MRLPSLFFPLHRHRFRQLQLQWEALNQLLWWRRCTEIGNMLLEMIFWPSLALVVVIMMMMMMVLAILIITMGCSHFLRLGGSLCRGWNVVVTSLTITTSPQVIWGPCLYNNPPAPSYTFLSRRSPSPSMDKKISCSHNSTPSQTITLSKEKGQFCPQVFKQLW